MCAESRDSVGGNIERMVETSREWRERVVLTANVFSAGCYRRFVRAFFAVASLLSHRGTVESSPSSSSSPASSTTLEQTYMYAVLVRYVEMSGKLSRATPTCMRRLRIGRPELGFYLASLDAAITRPTCTCAGFAENCGKSITDCA